MSRMEAAATPRLTGVVGSTFAGTLVGACAAGLLLDREWSYHRPDLSIPIILSLYVLDAALIVMVGLLALYLRYRSLPDIRTGMRRPHHGRSAEPGPSHSLRER